MSTPKDTGEGAAATSFAFCKTEGPGACPRAECPHIVGVGRQLEDGRWLYCVHWVPTSDPMIVGPWPHPHLEAPC